MTRADDETPLTAAGAARLSAILADALRAADRRRRRRVVVQASACASIAAVVVVITLALVARRESDRPIVRTIPDVAPTISPDRPGSPEPPSPHLVIEVIRPGDVRPKWEVISDDQLLAALADAGRPSGVVRLNGKAVIVPQ